MKTYLFIKTTDRRILGRSNNIIGIEKVASSYDNSSVEILYSVKSLVMHTEEVKGRLSGYGTFLTIAEAYALGKELQPDRDLEDFATEVTAPFSFVLPIAHSELKKQCQEDISLAGEDKAKSLSLKKTKTTEEDAEIDAFVAVRENILSEYESDKAMLGF